MSQPKFAAITSGLLARKGEARPWIDAAPMGEPVKPFLAWRPAEPPPPVSETLAEPEPPREIKGDWKKYALRITHHDYERLGILAVKQGKTRQRLLQDAVDRLFTGMSETYGGNCACLGGPKT